MLVSIELTPRHVKALADLERTTGKTQEDLLVHALENYIEQQQEYAELVAEVARADADFAAGRVYSSAEVMANAMSAVAKVHEREAAEWKLSRGKYLNKLQYVTEFN